MKTAREWLLELPENISDSILYNVIDQSTTSTEADIKLSKYYPSLKDVISGLFSWRMSEQGHEFWWKQWKIWENTPQDTLEQDIKELLTKFKSKRDEENIDDLDPWGSSMSSW